MSYDLFIAIGSGVVSGLVAIFPTFVAARYWTKVIVPWYEDRVYRDIKIAGEWDTQGDEHGDTPHEIAKVSPRRIVMSVSSIMACLAGLIFYSVLCRG